MDSWLVRKQKERHQRMTQLERVLLGIGVHGPSAISGEAAQFVRWMKKYWQDAHWQVMAAEREEWLRREAEAAHPPMHAPSCACWDCVLTLHSEAARHQAEMRVRREIKDEAY